MGLIGAGKSTFISVGTESDDIPTGRDSVDRGAQNLKESVVSFLETVKAYYLAVTLGIQDYVLDYRQVTFPMRFISSIHPGLVMTLLAIRRSYRASPILLTERILISQEYYTCMISARIEVVLAKELFNYWKNLLGRICGTIIR